MDTTGKLIDLRCEPCNIDYPRCSLFDYRNQCGKCYRDLTMTEVSDAETRKWREGQRQAARERLGLQGRLGPDIRKEDV